MMKKIMMFILVIAMQLCLFGCDSNPMQSKVMKKEFYYNDFQFEYVIDDYVDISTISVKTTYEDGSVVYTKLDRKNVSGLDNVTSTLGVKKLTLKYDDLIDNINIFVYYPNEYLYKEDYRSQFHYSKDTGWINDPNGLVYNAATGEYHLYYQDGPRMGSDPNNFWSSRSWGHAVSTDLIHWEQDPNLVIYPEPDGFGDIWSGCCVVDYENTSGLFDDSIDPRERIVAIYSVTRPQQQFCMAYSLDGGYTFNKYENNPVIDNSTAQYGGGFRDCKAFWYEEENCWLMVTAGESGLRLFSSTNLIDWEFNSFVTDNDGNIIGYECPMLFPLAVDGDDNNIKYVVSDGGTYYYIGSLIKNSENKIRLLIESEKLHFNGGSKHYATMNWTLDTDRIIFTSWIQDYYMESNSKDTPYRMWEGLMSIPYEASLKTNPAGKVQLYVNPISEFDILKGEEYFNFEDFDVDYDSQNIISDVKDKTFEITIDCNYDAYGTNSKFGFNVRKGDGEYISIYFDIASSCLVVDQRKTSVASYIDSIPIVVPKDKRITMRIIVDVSAIDVIINDGEKAISTIYFINQDNEEMEFFEYNCNVHINSMTVTHLNSIYHKNGR